VFVRLKLAGPSAPASAQAGPALIYVHDHQDAGFETAGGGHGNGCERPLAPSPSRDEREGVLYVNPGSAGPRRSNLPVTHRASRSRATALERGVRPVGELMN